MRGSQRFSEFQACVGLVAGLLIALHGVQGCGKPAPAFRAHAGADSGPAPGGEGGTGGGMTETGSTPPSSTGGAPGKADAGRGTGGLTGTGGTLAADAAVSTGGVFGGGGAPTEDAAPAGTGGMGTGGQVATGGASGTGGARALPDASVFDQGRPVGSGPAACYADPQVIRICKQLEPACQNCPDRSIWDECFRVSERGNDAACARYAVDNDCTVDQGGNWCGSLDCDAPGCPRANCRTVQGNGASAPCQALTDECPCN